MTKITTRPNILYVFADHMRSTAMGCTVVEKVLTPKLNRFATESTRLTNAVSNAPLCCPAWATLLSASYCGGWLRSHEFSDHAGT